jgi:hypothetical protein
VADQTVALFVAGSAAVELTVQDHVRVDRVTAAGAQRVGNLVQPGTTALRLAEGTYMFRTGQDVRVRVADGAAVEVVAVQNSGTKTAWPPPPAAAAWTRPIPADAGDTLPDSVPELTVVR